MADEEEIEGVMAVEQRAEEYLYDGVYASFDGWQIKIRTPRDNGDHVIYLEPRLWSALKSYAKQCGMDD